MSVSSQQQQLIDRYQILPTAQERLNALVDRAGRAAPLSEREKTEEHRVHGCQSKVYVVGHMDGGLCRFRAEADSVLVKGLVILLCELYSGGSPEDVRQVEPEILQKLGIWSILSPTRQNGLAHVRLAIKGWAEKLSQAP